MYACINFLSKFGHIYCFFNMTISWIMNNIFVVGVSKLWQEVYILQLRSDKNSNIYIYMNTIIITLYIYIIIFWVEIYMLTIYIYQQLITKN